MKELDCNCIQCVIECEKEEEIKRANYTVLIGEHQVPLCKEHYIQFHEDNIIFEWI